MIAKISAPILMRAFSETDWHRDQIQGFYDESRNRHYVRDLTLESSQQTRWTKTALRSQYNKSQREMLEEIERLGMVAVCEWLTENSPVTNTDI